MENQNKIRQIITYIFIGVFILGILGCIIFIATTDLTAKENGLLSIILIIISIVATWVVANIFANVSRKKAIAEVKEQHLNNLKTYALNAAEKVDNLSNELSRLSVYLQEELEKDDEEESELSKTERLESAIHIVNTLKSVNDTSLSDWKGVIGDELDEIREDKIERENELRDLVDRVEEVINHQNHQIKHLQSRQAHEQTIQIEALRKELTLAVNSVSGSFIKPKRTKTIRQQVENACPHCNHLIKYKQKPKPNSYKTVKCANCEKRSLARWYADLGFILEKEEVKDEIVNCPACKEQVVIKLSNIPFTKSVNPCPRCLEQIKISRKVNGISISKSIPPPPPEQPADEMEHDKLIKSVKDKLPKQPWPTAIHKKITQELGVPNHRVSGAIQRLIANGEFLPQIEGVVYYKKEDIDNATTDNGENK